MKKQVSVVILFLVICLAVAVLGCHQNQTGPGLEKPAIVKHEAKSSVSTPLSEKCTMHVYLIVAEGDGQITGVLDSISGKTATKDKPIGDRIRISGGDFDDIPRVLEIFATEKSNYKVFLKGKPKKDLSADITIEVVGRELFPGESRVIRLDRQGKGYLKIFLDPDHKKYSFATSKEAK